jgi:radical SAM superfamily enzyme YgiQ (UPF0313 family)
MYIAGSLKRAGHEIFFYDTRLSTGLENYVNKIGPDIIAYSIVTGSHGYYAMLNRELKKQFSFFSVFGGPHATFFPSFIEEAGVDAICRGEGEYAMVELVDRLSKGESVKNIENFWIKEEGIIYKNTLRPLENSLDAITFPEREVIYGYKVYKNRSNKYVLTSRGCPFNCTYCFNHSLKKLYKNKGNFCRKRSIENVMKEIESLRVIAPVKVVQFFDDIFILDKQWILEFCKVYRRRINIPFICYVRVNLVDKEIIEALKYAGVAIITFAIETADNHLRNNVLKRNISDEQISQTAKLLHQYDIKFFTQNMVGLPGETIKNALDTVKLNGTCKPSFAIASIFQPYPGTELTSYAIEKGLYDSNEEIDYDSFYEKSLLRQPDRKKFEKLSWLFPIAVVFFHMIFLIKFLIILPLGSIYRVIWHLSRSYGYFFRIRWIALSDVFRTLLTSKADGGSPFVED